MTFYRSLLLFACLVLCVPLRAMHHRKKQKIDRADKNAAHVELLQELHVAITTIIVMNLSITERPRQEAVQYDFAAERQRMQNQFFQRSVAKLRANRELLKTLTFKDLNLSDSFMPLLLKGLVLKRKCSLLEDFLDMSERMDSALIPDAVNFIYATNCIQHTFLDVAYTQYIQVRSESKPGITERRIIRSVIRAGGELLAWSVEELSGPMKPELIQEKNSPVMPTMQECLEAYQDVLKSGAGQELWNSLAVNDNSHQS